MLQKLNKKYILTVFVIMILLLSIWLMIYLFPPLAQNLPPLPAHPASIVATKKIYDLGSNHHCQINPFSQNIDSGEYAIFQVSLHPSYENSVYELEFGNLPQDVNVEMPLKRGRGNDQLSFSLVGNGFGSFTITLAYHEYQLGKFKWLTNYCLFNVVLQ